MRKLEKQIEVDLRDGRVLRGDESAVNAYLAAREARAERNRRWPQTPDGDVDTRAAMTTLAHSFPSLVDADGTAPWDVERFVRWLCGPVPSGGARRAGFFVLHVWNAREDFRPFARELGLEGAESLEPFNLSEALGVWDDDHRRAFLAWVEAPFWP